MAKPLKKAEKKDAKKTEQKTKITKNKKKLYLIVGVFAAVLLLWTIILLFVLINGSKMTAGKLLNAYAEGRPYISNIVEKYDPDDMAGDKNEYATKSAWDDRRLKATTEDYAGTIEVFNNEKDAELREWYLNRVVEKCAEYISAQKYGEELREQTCDSLGYGFTHRAKNVIIRLSRAYSEEQVNEYKKGFNELIKKYEISDYKTPSDEEVSSIKAEKEKRLDKINSEQELEIKKHLGDKAKSFDGDVKTAVTNLDENSLKEVNEALLFFKNIPYFNEKAMSWEQQIADAFNKIEQKKVEEAQRLAAEKAAKTRTFSTGMYEVGTDIESGIYNITAIGGKGTLRVSGDNYIVEMMSVSGGKYYITNYKNARLSYGDEIKITSGLVVKFEIAN